MKFMNILINNIFYFILWENGTKFQQKLIHTSSSLLIMVVIKLWI